MRLTTADQAMLAKLRARGPDLINRAISWCTGNSGSDNAEGLAAQRAMLGSVLVRLPGTLQAIPLASHDEVDRKGEHTAGLLQPALHLSVRPEAPVRVILTGHYDTVYPAGSTFRAVVQRADGALNGPGIADMKGGLSIMLGALEAFEHHPLASRVGYEVLLSPDEEIGSPGSAVLLDEIAVRGHVGLTYEPCLPDGTLVSGRMGSGNFHVTLRGRAAHAGRAFHEGRNALAGAAALAAQLHALNGQRDSVTLNIAKLDGGGPLNVVPDSAVLRFNVRVGDIEATDWVIEQLNLAIRAITSFDLGVQVHGGFHRPPKPVDAGQERLMHAVGAAGALLDLAIRWRGSGGVCEGNNLHAAGLPNIDTLGVQGGDIHSPNEHAWPESFAERACLSATILCKIASGEIDAIAIRESMPKAHRPVSQRARPTLF